MNASEMDVEAAAVDAIATGGPTAYGITRITCVLIIVCLLHYRFTTHAKIVLTKRPPSHMINY